MKDTAIKFFLNILFIPIFWFLSYIFPKKDNLILLGSSFGNKFLGNTKFFYLYLLKNSIDLEFYWITKNRTIYNDFRNKGFPVLYLYSIRGFWNILKAKLLLVEQSSQDVTGRTFVLGNFNLINLWHGVPIKKISFDVKPSSFYDKLLSFFMSFEYRHYLYIMFPHKEATIGLKKAFLGQPLFINSYPRSDIFFINKFNDNIKEQYNLSQYKKIILYAPTFRDKVKSFEPFSVDFLKKLNDYCVKNNSVFIIKNHSLYGNNLRIGQFSNIVDMSSEIQDIHEFLLVVDLLITDYSSICFDFMLANKPIIYYSFDYNYYIDKCRLIYLNYYNDLPGPFVLKESDLLVLIETLGKWFTDSSYKEKYNNTKRRFNYYHDGKSSKRLLVLIKGLLKKI